MKYFQVTIFFLLLGFILLARADAAACRHLPSCGCQWRCSFHQHPHQQPVSFYRREEGGGNTVADIIRRYAIMFQLEEALIRAIIKAESNYDPQALSKKGAMGFMQLIPETAREMQVTNPFNPEENIRGGSRYLRLMLNQFDEDVELALAAYNAGPGAVSRYGGIPPFEETKTYVRAGEKISSGLPPEKRRSPMNFRSDFLFKCFICSRRGYQVLTAKRSCFLLLKLQRTRVG